MANNWNVYILLLLLLLLLLSSLLLFNVIQVIQSEKNILLSTADLFVKGKAKR